MASASEMSIPEGLSAETLAALQQHMQECKDGAPSAITAEPVNLHTSDPDLNVAEYGTNEYWLERWQAASEAQEWFVVDIDKVWPYMIPACEEHDLCGDTGRHKAVLELGAGTSRLGLDLVKLHGVNGVIVTDIAEEPMRMQEDRAVQELGAAAAATLTSYVADDACAMQFRDEQFCLVYDKGTNDCIRLSADAELLPRFVSEVDRALCAKGFYIFVTCQHIPDVEPWLELFEHLQTDVVLRDGPATTNIVVLRKLK